MSDIILPDSVKLKFRFWKGFHHSPYSDCQLKACEGQVLVVVLVVVRVECECQDCQLLLAASVSQKKGQILLVSEPELRFPIELRWSSISDNSVRPSVFNCKKTSTAARQSPARHQQRNSFTHISYLWERGTLSSRLKRSEQQQPGRSPLWDVS